MEIWERNSSNKFSSLVLLYNHHRRVLLFFILVISAPIVSRTSAALLGLSSLGTGSSLAAERENDFLVSRNGIFSAGFYEVGTNAVCFAIWFNIDANRSTTVIWMANRDVPVSSKKSRLILEKDGNLRLTDEDGSSVWSTNTFSNSGVEAHLLDTGNLVLLDQARGKIIWQSFDFPTDTLLPSQRLNKNTTLVSTRGSDTYFSGFYNAKFDDNNVFDLIFNGPLVSSVYWPSSGANVFSNGRTPYNSTRMATLDDYGQFFSTDNLVFNASDYGIRRKRRLKLDYDGMLRLYSLDESNGLWEISWMPSLDACSVHGLCGEYGICVYRPNPTCDCPSGFLRNDHSDWSKGCSPSFNLSTDPKNIGFVHYPRTDYYGYDLEAYNSNSTLEACQNSCRLDQRCLGFGYRQGSCYPKGTLLNGFQMPHLTINMHIKVPIEVARHGRQVMNTAAVPELKCSGASAVPLEFNTTGLRKEATGKNGYLMFLIAFAAAGGGIEAICFALLWFFLFRKHDHEDIGRIGYTMLATEFKRFSYAELKRATGNFKEEIGRGGFGTVYKGILDNEQAVAVKRLEGLTQGDAEFWAEVSIIGKINHKNLAKLWGFCAEGEQKLLVYEFVSNGSLDTLLFQESSADQTLGFDKRYNIALGTAKGLSYLHEECLEWVLHCDVKPQNILLDDNLEPKVSDFGMSRLVKDIHDEGFSRVRGTRGYLAPEWLRNNKINAKVDVYSYGIVLLELLTGKSAPSFLSVSGTSHTSEQNDAVQGAGEGIRKGEFNFKGTIDPRLSGYSEKKLENLVRTALLCVQEDPDSRPAMSKVVELLCEDDESSEDHSSN